MRPNKNHPELKNEKKCDCGPECDCGCNEGKECHCDHPHGERMCECHGEKCRCGCHRGCGGKFIVLLLVFLAGVGFNELLHGCFGRCPSKAPCNKHMVSAQIPHQGGMPMFTDGNGTVIIINAADGHTEMMHANKHCRKHMKDLLKPHNGMHKQNIGKKDHSLRPFPTKPETTDEKQPETQNN